MTKKLKQTKILICLAILMVLCISFIMVGIVGNQFAFAEEVPTVDVTELATVSDSTDIGYKLKLVDEDNNFIGYVNSYECINPNHCTCISSTARILHENDLFNIQLFKSNFIEHYAGKPGYHVKGLLNKDGAQFGWSGNFVPNLGEDEEIIIKVKVEPNKYNIIFDSQGGIAVTNRSVTYGDIIELPTTTKTGYEFAGWVIDGNKYNVGEKFTPSSLEDGADIRAVAKWTGKTYTVTFNTNGGNSISNKVVTFGEDYSLPLPNKNYYEFTNWTRADNGAIVSNSGKWDIASNVTLNANWESKSYSIVYHSNRSGSLNNPSTITYGQSVSLMNQNFEITERSYNLIITYKFYTTYTFEGWYYDSALTQKFNGTFTPTVGLNENTVHLYAKHSIKCDKKHAYVGEKIVHVPSYVTGIEVKGSFNYPIIANSRTNPLTISLNNASLSIDDKNEAIKAMIEGNYLTIVATGNNTVTGGNGCAAVTTTQLELVLLSSSTLTLQGGNGSDGRKGTKGADGEKGSNTSVTGGNASNGGNGLDGTDGKDGISGGSAVNASILKISSKTTADTLKFIGGNGGNGGAGGKGGAGGAGGDDDTSKVNGKAGAGGKGGNGGNGGRGGDAGKAFYNPSMRIINETNANYTVTNGKAGTGGEAGAGGAGGAGGDAGLVGKDGSKGTNGNPGTKGADGNPLLD